MDLASGEDLMAGGIMMAGRQACEWGPTGRQEAEEGAGLAFF